MNWVNHKTLTKAVAASAILLVCGYFVRPSFAGIGDSPLEAYFLPFNSEMKDTIGPENKPDYYYLIVPATGRVVIRLYDIVLQDPADGLNISLFRTTQNSVGLPYPTYWNYVASSQNTSMTPDIIDIPNLVRGIYSLQVWTQRHYDWDGATYKIRAEYTVFPPVVSDDVGDKREYALPIVNQLPTKCTLSGTKDVDWFECQVPYDTNLTLSLTEISAVGNVDMEVYTAWGVMIGSATEPGNANELLYLPDLVPGQYFIRVFGEGTPQYTFTAKQEFAKAIDILDDVGNDLAHAMPLLPGNPSVFCLQPFNTDNDFFSMYQPQDGVLTVDVFDIFLWDGADDLYVQVLDEYGNVVVQSENAPGVPEHIEVNLPRGQYFIAVYGQRHYDFDGAIYTIDVKTSTRDVGDAFNEAMQIHAIPYGSETYGYPYIGMMDRPGDVDFFQVLLKDAGFIYLTVDQMLYTNVDVQLFDAEHNLLQTSAYPGVESDETIYIDGLGAGVYFIKVDSPEGGMGQYRLTPTVGTPTSTISDDIGNDTSKAFSLIPYRRINGYIWNENTSDYFKFTLGTANNLVRIHVDNVHMWDMTDDIKLSIFNGSGTQIKSSDNAVLQDEIVELRDVGPGTYYAAVTPKRHYDMDPVQYCIVVETDAAPLPSAALLIPVDLQGIQGEIIYVPVILGNERPPDEITSMSIGVQFDPSILDPLGICNAELTLTQWNAQMRYARTENTISVSMNNFSTLESGELLSLIFKVRSGVSVGSTSALIMSASTLNGAIVPWVDGMVTVVAD